MEQEEKEYTLYRVYEKPIKVLDICGLFGRESTDGDTFYVSRKILKSDLQELLDVHDEKHIRLYVFTNPFKKGDNEPDATIHLEATESMWNSEKFTP